MADRHLNLEKAMKFMTRALGVCCTLVLFLGCQQSDPVAAPPQVTEASQGNEIPMPSSRPSALITASELSELLKSDSGRVRVLEPGCELADFEKGHLPTARFVHWVDDMTDPAHRSLYRHPDNIQFANLMTRLDVRASDHVVIYDRFSSRLSTRLFWTLKHYAHGKVQVLDGGFEAWTEDLETSADARELPDDPYQYKIGHTNDGVLARLHSVEQSINKPETCLIDGRPREQFTGEAVGKVFHTGEEHPRKGHIPGAVNVVWEDNFDEDGKFKSVEALRELYNNAGVKANQSLITYCNEGLHAAPAWFVLTQILELKRVKLYDDSMAEWAKTDNAMESVKE